MTIRIMKPLLLIIIFLMAACASHKAGPVAQDDNPDHLHKALPAREVVEIQMDQYTQKIDNFILIFDPSTSMSANHAGQTRFELAKDTINHLNKTIPDIKLVGGVRSFGNPVYTSLIYGLTDYTKDDFEFAIKTITVSDGASPLDFALAGVAKDFEFVAGKTAVLIISDGQDMDIQPVLAAVKMKQRFKDEVCIYTIIVGNDPGGQEILNQVAIAGQCGFAVNADNLVDGRDMADFVKKVFLTEKEAPLKQPAGDSKAVTASSQFKFGDADGDGITDDKDQCPGTPKGARVDENGCWLIGDVLFDFDKYNIKPAGYPTLNEVADIMRNNPGFNIEIQGHTDIIGPEKYNDRLSINRATSGKKYLIKQGISKDRMLLKGFGYSRPKTTNNNVKGRAENRRIEFKRGN